MDVYVRHLRDTIDRPFGRHPIETVWGSGCRLGADADALGLPRVVVRRARGG